MKRALRHTPLFVAFATFAPVASLTTLGCDDGDFTPLNPELQLVDPADEAVSPCTEDQVRSCAHTFGEVPANQGRRYTVRLINGGDAVLAVREITIAGDPAFTILETPVANDDGEILIRPSDDEDAPSTVTIEFKPQLASDVEATLTVVSDANNVGEDENVTLVLSGRGAEVGGPCIDVQPDACAFGQIGVGATGYCDLTVLNCGERDLVIDDLDFSESTPLALDGSGNFDTSMPGFGSDTLFTVPHFVSPGSSTGLRLFATLDAIGGMTGELIFRSNDAANPNLAVPLTAEGADAPTAVAEVLSVNGDPATDPLQDIRPLDDVVLTGMNSVPSGSATITEYHWELLGPPDTTAPTSVRLSDEDNVDTGFEFDSSAGTVAGLDVAGQFVASLTVVDDLGRSSTNDARVILQAVPDEAFHVQLTWDSPDYDLDLHVIMNGADYCSPFSCYFGNCRDDPVLNVFGPPEWDGVAGFSEGDPTLDIDDLNGYGPENINIDAPADGTYRVAVHGYTSIMNEDVNATVRIYISGVVAYEETRIIQGRDLWEVADVSWAAGASTVFPVGAVSEAWSCP